MVTNRDHRTEVLQPIPMWINTVDNLSDRRWSWNPAITVGCWAIAGLALLWVVLTGDAPGRLLAAMLTIVALAAAVYTTLVRPVLVADSAGVTIRSLAGALRVPWKQATVRLAHTQRLGREVQTLELDLRHGVDGELEKLVVLGRLELGADPHDVMDELTRLRG
ncbi:PH domain-containing protein [Pseudonocardiaceae bacterium YIM PH 21723]|nr:PH domain-containing protein [Pseudonocardiaceae bacterium YIM PH 21723]